MSKLNKKTLIVLSLGLFIASAAQVVGHMYPAMPDMYRGLMVGVGLGMMLFAFIKRGSAHTN
jgi:hypothetical protein